MARTEVNARWQAAMAELFQTEGAPDEAWEIIPEVFNLENQLQQAGRALPNRVGGLCRECRPAAVPVSVISTLTHPPLTAA